MLSDKYRILVYVVLLFTLTVNFVLAGTTGKIAGRVMDKETGEPLIGVNVVIKGSSLGAATDIDGYFAILNIPPGVHTVVASMVGYSLVTVNEVRVLIDQTTPVDIQMAPQSIEASAVDIVAERNVIKKDVSTSVSSVQTEEIQALPVSSVNQIVGLQAGVEDGMMIRGGTSDQLLLQIDGITQRDPRDNTPISTVALTSIQEVSIEKGGFNAEYGQVQSGIINIVGKEGNASKYSAAAQVRYSPPGPKNFGISFFDPNSVWNKAYLDPAVCWTGTDNGSWDYYTQRQYLPFEGWNAVSQRLLKDDNPYNDLSPAAAQRVWEWEHRRRPQTDQPDYNIDASFGGPVPFISSSLGDLRFFTSYTLNREMSFVPLTRDDYKEYNWSIKVNSDISKDMKLMLTANTGSFYTSAKNIEGDIFHNPTDYFHSPFSIAQTFVDRDGQFYSNGYYSDVQVKNLTLGAKFTHVITPTTFYEVSIENVNRYYTTGPVAGRNQLKYIDPTDLAKYNQYGEDSVTVIRLDYNGDPNLVYIGDPAARHEVVPGYWVSEVPMGYSSKNDNSPISGMFLGGHSGEDLDSSIVRSYKAKFDLTSQVNKSNMVKFGVEFNSYDLKLNYAFVAPGYGSRNAVNTEWKPYQFAAYLQDKIEMYGFIANVGLRMDVSNPNTDWVVVDPFDKSYYSSDYNANADYPKQKASVNVSFSPRLGISHPITENSKLYFNYGHFLQLPAYQEVLRLGRGANGSLSNSGDPNLIPAKTIAYELGYDHVLFDYYLLQIQAYYRDISDVQAYTQYTSDLKGIGYYKATNNRYADIRGFELTFRKSEGDWVRGFVTYTYEVSTNGAFGAAAINDDPAVQRQLDQTTQSLYQQKPIPQPHARASVTFLTPKNLGPDILGLKPLDNWSLNILADWRAGSWLNYNPKGAQEYLNIPNVQLADYFNIDLRLNKSFNFKNINLMVFIDVRNLFNIRRLSGVGYYYGFDQQFYYQSLHLPESTAYDNIPGDDRINDYRKDGVAFQPIEQAGNVYSIDPNSIHYTASGQSAIYYNTPTKQYLRYVNNSWSEVPSGEMKQILDDKAYIDMPNITSSAFLDPRQIFFGINISFNF
ncbi:MAG: TonB-dependent receptor [Ignavibacteriales bacterium]|nr:TonB-dependent receptor [Ignavibacteriales bacterium]